MGIATTAINALATGLFVKDIVSPKKAKGETRKSTGTGKLILNGGLIVAGAFLANKVVGSYLEKATAAKAGDGTKEGTAALYAIQLREAFHPFFEVPFGLPDGTNEERILEIGRLVKAQNLHSLVISAYYDLYKSEFVRDLEKEGATIFAQYMAIINGSGTTGGTGGTGTPPKNDNGNGTSQIHVGDTVYTYGGKNLRDLSGKKVKLTTAGEKWYIISWKTATFEGITGTWVMIENLTSWTYYIFITGLYKK